MSSMSSLNILIIILITINSFNIQLSESRKHHLVLTNDARKYFTVSTFGFFFGGQLKIKMDKFSFDPFKIDSIFGFTLAKTMSDSLTPYLEGHQDRCLLLDDVSQQNDDNIGLVSMVFNLTHNIVQFKCNEKLSALRLHDSIADKQLLRSKRNSEANKTQTKTVISSNAPVINELNNNKSKIQMNDNKLAKIDSKVSNEKKLSDIESNGEKKSDINYDNDNDLKTIGEEEAQPVIENKDTQQTDAKTEKSSCLLKSVPLVKTGDVYSFELEAFIADQLHVGLYTLFFHNCPNYGWRGGLYPSSHINLSIYITEVNMDNYLSAGEIPLPQLYFALSVIFFIIGFIWVNVIRNKKEDAFKIHYLMASLVFVKAFSLLFHGINYHYIAKEGSQVETWAVLYYITHLLKGALLFITIVLIGTGWAFIKHILSDKDKKIFMIVIPLQVLANIADIITEESEEGAEIHNMWREIFILVDLLCCGAILFPVVWSIRHLQEASQTDGKAAINLRKLKLFRHFYVMIVCYIYFTRIIVYLLKITVPFQYEWLNIFFQHAATLLFFILTGYYFQPASSNPYFQLLQDEDDLEMEEVLFVQPNSFSETKKRNRDIRDIEANDSLITKRESSHDFD